MLDPCTKVQDVLDLTQHEISTDISIALPLLVSEMTFESFFVKVFVPDNIRKKQRGKESETIQFRGGYRLGCTFSSQRLLKS